MRNYLNNLKSNKKGFSLVELIIVIAIMAILVGIVASQVIPYLEKSRKGKDQQQLSSLTTAIVSTIADHSTAVTAIAAKEVKDWDGSTNHIDSEFTNNLIALMDKDGNFDSGDTLANNAIIPMCEKFKSKAYTDVVNKTTGAGVWGKLDSGTTTTWVSTSSTIASDEKLKAVSE